MPIRHCIIHLLEQQPDTAKSTLHPARQPLDDPDLLEPLLAELNERYNTRPGKLWGFFPDEPAAPPFQQALSGYLGDHQDFLAFTCQAARSLQQQLENQGQSCSGHLLFAHYQQGMSDFLLLALLQHRQGLTVTDQLALSGIRYLDLAHLHLAARINLSEWQNNRQSRQYISLLSGKNGQKAIRSFQAFIGCEEGADAPAATRTLLRAFDDYVAKEALDETRAQEKTGALLDYASHQARLGQPVTLEELSGLLDEEQPRAFYEHIRQLDYGLAPKIPADRRTLQQFHRISGRSDGLSISFESHLLGSQVEYDEARDQLIIRQLPDRLKEQLRRRRD